MDQTQQKALNALEPYILLSKSANSPRAAADLVTQATTAPNTFVFAELLQTPNIQSLQTASKEYAPYLTLLQIFAWGTWSDYIGLSKFTPAACSYKLILLIQKHQISQSSQMYKNRSSVSSLYSPSPHPPQLSHTRICSLSSPFPPLAPWKTSS